MKNIKFIAGGIFFALLITFGVKNSENKLAKDNSLASVISMSQAGAETLGEWWNSEIYKCVPGCTCMTTVLFHQEANGSWAQGSGGFGASNTELRLSGTRTECSSGNVVAHCWNCTSRDCVVPNEVIIAALQALN